MGSIGMGRETQLKNGLSMREVADETLVSDLPDMCCWEDGRGQWHNLRSCSSYRGETKMEMTKKIIASKQVLH